MSADVGAGTFAATGAGAGTSQDEHGRGGEVDCRRKCGGRVSPGSRNAPAGITAGCRWHLADMHCHLDRMANAEEVARDARARGIALFCTTVSPVDALAAQARFGDRAGIRVGMGLHPWWVADAVNPANEANREDPAGQAHDAEAVRELASRLAAGSCFVGEVGLDLSANHLASAQAQLAALGAIAHACAESPIEGRVISLHAVRAVDETLDILERHGLTESARCIFHWFSGTSDQLTRARDAGCLFSVGERMLATKRGRAYAQQIPCGRLLLETDAPARLDEPYGAGELERSLHETLEALALLHRMDAGELAEIVTKTSLDLLALP